MSTPEDTARKQVEKRSIDGQRHESLFLSRTNLLTKNDPIEGAVLEYAIQINKNTAPTNAKQAELVRAVKHNLPYSRHNIIELNRGLLATIAYPFKAYSYDDTDELMDAASFALLEAAVKFDTRTDHGFVDFAAPIVQDALVGEVPWLKQNGLLSDDEQPIHTIIRFTSTVKNALTPTELLLKAEQDQELSLRTAEVEPLSAFTPFQQSVLPYINLSTQEIMQQTNLSQYNVGRAAFEAGKRVGVSGRKGLAAYLLERGFVFDIPAPTRPPNEILDSRQIVFAQNLHLSNDKLTQLTGVPENSIGPIILKLQKRLGAKTRVDLMLMARMYDGGELRQPDDRSRRDKLAGKLGWKVLDVERIRSELTKLSERQRTFVEAYYLSNREMDLYELAREHDVNIQAARSALKNGLNRLRKLGKIGDIKE